MQATDVMTTSVVSVRPDTSIIEIAEILLAKKISAVPVVDKDGGLVGIVSEGDLIHRFESGTERNRSWWLAILTGKEILARDFIKSHANKASDVMTHPVISVKPDTPLAQLAALLEKHRIKRVPVVDNGRMVGIVSRANLVQALVNVAKVRIADQPIDDVTLCEKLMTDLRVEPWWSDSINITVSNGTVKLWGLVGSETEREAVRVFVEQTPGVHDITNYIGIERGPTGQ